MAAFLDLCRFVPTDGGTTSWTYSSVVGGCQSPDQAGAVSGTNYKIYAVSSDLTQWELSEGAYNSSTKTFARTTVLANSAGSGTKQGGTGTLINFGAVPNVAVVGVKEDLISVEEANNFTTVQQLQARTNLGMSSEVGKIEWWPCSDVPAGRLRADGGSYLRATYPDLSNFLIKTGAATFTNGSPNLGMVSHGRSVNDPVKLFTTGILPTNFTAGTHGLVTAGTVYYVKSVVDANTVTLTASPGGAAISAGSAGSGTHSWVCAPHGDGDGSTTFTVPDYRGEFLRGLDNGAGVDTNRSAGSVQLDAMQGHIHSSTVQAVSPSGGGWNITGGGGGFFAGPLTLSTGGPQGDGTNGPPRTTSETRPRNVAALVTIRYTA
ncbi:phage tail protein [Bradyrhizobium sp. Tv2a-2]|uniref:phage tail protein n=1 Tax=Bradyrhizobium sp. Tv2a-2 TaxID=113395 RepID=UPI00042101A6|nr:phage tail protein [Bradyrhizobium sp. Tv2a-2]